MFNRKNIVLSLNEVFSVLEKNRESIRGFGVKRLGLFGSCVRGEFKGGSDLDFLVEFDKPTFKNFMGLSFLLEDLFKTKVDLITPEGLSPYMKPYIEKEVKWYET